MKRVDQWETVAAIADHVNEHRNQGGYMSAYAIAVRLDKLARIGRTLDRLHTAACNDRIKICKWCRDGVSFHQDGHIPKICHFARVESLEKRAEKIGAELGCVVTTQRDPRGPAIRVWADKEDGRLLGVFS